jgi:hypothetical protein
VRFVIREQDYEELLASGRFRYEKNGRPTGAYESWRLTRATAGYCFLRVDLDGQEAKSGESVLFHLIMSPKGKVERLKYLQFGPNGQSSGDVQLDRTGASSGRIVLGKRHDETIDLPADYVFWFPSTIGVALLARSRNQDATLKAISPDRDHDFILRENVISIEYAEKEYLVVTDREILVRRCSIHWDNELREIWLDEQNWPLKLRRGDSLEAIETHYVRCI